MRSSWLTENTHTRVAGISHSWVPFVARNGSQHCLHYRRPAPRRTPENQLLLQSGAREGLE